VLCLHAGWLLHVLSLLSSSFVEEEHQTCYFLAVTTWLAIAAQLTIHKLQHANNCRTTDQSLSKKPLSTGFSLVLLCSAISYTHAHPFNGPFSGTTRVSRYQKGKTNVDFTEARDNEWQWHQLDHM